MKVLNIKWLALILLIGWQISGSFAQINVPNTLIGSGSYSTERPKISIAYSFGETFIFSTSGGNIYCNQGFHNSEITQLVAVTDLPHKTQLVNIFKN